MKSGVKCGDKCRVKSGVKSLTFFSFMRLYMLLGTRLIIMWTSNTYEKIGDLYIIALIVSRLKRYGYQ